MKTEPSYPLKQLTDLQKMQISDLADGQLQGEEFAQAMALMNDNDQARTYWHSLHLVGDVIRAKIPVSAVSDADFLSKFRAYLAKEPVSLTIGQVVGQASSYNIEVAVAANQPFFNWKWAAGLSALAASVMLGMNLVGITAVAPANSSSQLAQTSVSVILNGQSAVMLRNPQLDALIAAHNQVGGSSALQMPSGFLRSATFTPSVLGDK